MTWLHAVTAWFRARLGDGIPIVEGEPVTIAGPTLPGPAPTEDTPITVPIVRVPPPAAAALPSGMASPHFSWGELGCSDGSVVPAELRPGTLELVGYLEAIRAACGGHPMRVKVYRSPRWNDHVGGAERSQHLLARAADIRIAGVAPQIVHATVLRLIAKGEIAEGGVGLYLPRPALEARPATATTKARPARAARITGWVHYDCRGTRARWTG